MIVGCAKVFIWQKCVRNCKKPLNDCSDCAKITVVSLQRNQSLTGECEKHELGSPLNICVVFQCKPNKYCLCLLENNLFQSARPSCATVNISRCHPWEFLRLNYLCTNGDFDWLMKPTPDESCLLKSPDDTVNIFLDGRVAGQSHGDAVWRKAFLDPRIKY